MRRFLAAILGISAPVESASPQGLSDRHIAGAVRDLSNNDPIAVDAAEIALRTGLPAADTFADLPPDMLVFGTIASSLERSERMISLDWKEDLTECEAAFAALFDRAGVDASEASALIALAKMHADGSGVGAAYIAFRQLADAAGMRIVGLNADSDMYHFVLTTRDNADRWRSVAIGPNQYIEDSDWQFLSIFEAMGISPRSTEHPSKTARPAPATR